MTTRSDREAFLAAGATLAGEIVDAAIWHHGRCNWTGAATFERTRATGGRPSYAALGPNLYNGTAGVALFLAEAAVRLRDSGIRDTALGAIRHAVGTADSIDARAWDGLYEGPLGVALAAARVGRLLDAERTLRDAGHTAATWRREQAASASADVMSGHAGSIVALLALHAALDETWMIEAATALGERLLDGAERTADGWSWPAPQRRALLNLCGFAHGTSGIAQALLELHAANGDGRFRHAAERAFDYERAWASRAGVWPDLRDVGRRVDPEAPLPAADSWCHGAPGIAIARLRAMQLGDGSSADTAGALAATRAIVCRAIAADGGDDFSLCHGAAGAADALLYGGESDEAAALGRLGIERCLGTPHGFPCGVPFGTTPALMVGRSGIGLFYLRLHDQRVPSALVIHP